MTSSHCTAQEGHPGTFFHGPGKLKGRLDFSHQPVVACLPVVIGNLCDVIFNDVSLKTT